MITAAVIALFKLPKKIFITLIAGAKKVKNTLAYLFIPEKKKGHNKSKRK